MRKKIVCLIMTALIVLSVVPAVATAAPIKAVLSPQSLEVDGTLIDCEKYNINGSNYFKLRDIAKMLNNTPAQFEVGYDNNAQAISITTGFQYTPVGGELEQRGDYSSSTVVSEQKLYVNGEEVNNLAVYNIGGNNFFKLRDLATLVGCAVDYNAQENKAIVISNNDCVEVTSFDDLVKALETYSKVILTAEEGKEDTALVKATKDLTINQGQTLIVEVPLYFGGNYKLINNGTLINNINYVRWVTLDVAVKKTDAYGRKLEEQIYMITHSDLYVSGSNTGFTPLSDEQLEDGSFYVYDGFRKVADYYAMLLFNGNAYFENNGVFNNNSAFSVEEKATAVNNGIINTARSFELFNEFDNKGSINNSGNLVLYGGATFNNNGKLTNSERINISGDESNPAELLNNSGAIFVNNHRFYVKNGEFVNSGVFTNNGVYEEL